MKLQRLGGAVKRLRGPNARAGDGAGESTGVVSGRTYHTALTGPPDGGFKPVGEPSVRGLASPFLKPREPRGLVGLTDHSAPGGGVRGYDTETSMLHTKRHVRSKI